MRYDPERDRWSRRATETLLWPIARDNFNVLTQDDILYAWNNLDMDRLDKEYGVDAILHTKERRVALAIRIRGHYYYRTFGDVTVRLDSLQTLGKMLEMQKSIARFMFYAWGDTDKPELPTVLVDWHVIFLHRLIDSYLKGKIAYRGPFWNNDESSRLVAFTIAELKNHGLICKSKGEVVLPESPQVAIQPQLFSPTYLEALGHDNFHKSYYDD